MIINNIQSKEISGFERYLVNSVGQIYDTKNKKNICQWIDNVGYYQCNLYDKDGKKYYKRVHRIVAETFIPNPNNYQQVNHINGNKRNNSIDNLEWTTNSKNTQHGYDNNLYKFKSRSYPINVYDKNGIYLTTYKSIRSLCKDLKLNRKTVTSILKHEKITNNYNYLFEYVEESATTIESIAV